MSQLDLNRPRANGIELQHTHGGGVLGTLKSMLHLDGHTHGEPTARDPALSTEEGIRTVWLALAALSLTSVIQIVIVMFSGSVALLADTVHNIGDTLNSIPLLAAFYLARKVATRRYTYGFGRAEDLAGVLIVVSIAFSAGVILWESFDKLLNPQPMRNIPWVIAASIIGFLGNEAVALLQIRTGRKIGSEAMVADGLHARIDGLTSLAVMAAAFAALLGFAWLDPLIGLCIGIAIVFITKDAAIRVWRRLMDGVDPHIVDRIEQGAGEVAGVKDVRRVQARWSGHALHAEVVITVDDALSLEQSRLIARRVRAGVSTLVPQLSSLTLQVDGETLGREADARQNAMSANVLPPRYRDSRTIVSAAPMGAAALKYDEAGKAAWNEIWTGYCELALAGGPPHRGNLLEPVDPAVVAANPEGQARVLDEIERGLKMVTGLPVVHSERAGWIGLKCKSQDMAVWLLRAITVENVAVRREGDVLFLPAGPDFRLEREIKSVVTVVAKTNHYWTEHAQSLEE
jgi:cation diffusion facilitator family transporter